MDAAIEYADQRIEAAKMLDRVLADPTVAIQSHESLPWAVETATWRSFPQINAFVYTELQSSGNLALIQSDSLRRKLANHYTYFQHESRVGLDLEAQHQFEKYTAGILTIDELVAVENGSWGVESSSISVARTAQIADALRREKDAAAWLPSLVQHHTFIKKVIIQGREQAEEIIGEIDGLISSLAGKSITPVAESDFAAD